MFICCCRYSYVLYFEGLNASSAMSELMRYPQFKQKAILGSPTIISMLSKSFPKFEKTITPKLSFTSLKTLTFKLNSHEALSINFKEDSFAFTEKRNMLA